MNKITSDELIKINQNFRVTAGPGAGKTYWLINHINNVLKNSTKISGIKKIACITYTNIGVDTIRNRLKDNINVDVMTIHSFLYYNVVKPYASFTKNDYVLNASLIDGHDEPRFHKSVTINWLENHSNVQDLKHPFSLKQLTQLNNNLLAICNWLISMKATLDGEDIKFECNNKKAVHVSVKDDKKIRTQINNQTLNILKSDLLKYKTELWKIGVVDHEDILYISYRLIKDNPFIIKVLRSKYPYYFIDEYQDTNPIQSEILKLISNDDVIIGVIGDEAQSIFGFQGSDVSLFKENIASNVIEYVIEDNRRSTEKIVGCLNLLRKNMQQRNLREDKGTMPMILVGDKKAAQIEAKRLYDEAFVQILSRNNITSNIMKGEYIDLDFDKDLIEIINSTDSPSSGNGYRSMCVIQCLRSVELAKQNNFYDSIREMRKALDLSKEKNGNLEAIKSIQLLLSLYETYENKKLIEFVSIIKQNICPKISNLRSGSPKRLYEQTEYKQAAVCINISEDTSNSKTIHKAKGDEYDNVLVVLNTEKELDFLLDTDLLNNEEHRIYYVAITRAKNNLLISVPKLSKKNRKTLANHYQIKDV